MTTTTSKPKTVDLPPKGSRNADPMTGTPGAHPIETGTGALVGGAVSGAAAGMAAGPVGVVVGAALGAVAGGYAGKGIGELIDPTTEDNWLRDNFSSRPYVRDGETYDDYVPAYQFGGRAEASNVGRSFEDVEADVRNEYDLSGKNEMMPWGAAKPAVADAYRRSCQLRTNREDLARQ